MRLLCALGLFSALLHVTSCLLIGAFNIRHFGEKKSGIKDPKKEYEEARNTIKKIINRYDIILIQEVRDKDWKVTKGIMDLVNKDIPIDSPHHFDNISSDYLPVTEREESYKERYLFLYKNKKVTVKDSFHYNEGKRGVFERPPFVVKFSSTETAGKEFVLIPIHTKPGHAVKEIDALVDVVDAAEQSLKNNNIMVLGDFNAGGKYVKKDDWKNIRRLCNETNFNWLIENNVDTTVLRLKFAYDRIVVTTDMNKGVVEDSARVFDFWVKYDLNLEKAWRVSNHFPVEVELELKLLENPKKRAQEPVEKPDRNPKKAKQIHQNPN
ncbi:hypothetical protein JOQ06_015385 [Pogonophryne albipinna]|uniref:Endonuclease/exonuclease/phosphatase domain-containing protein n=1 Tax=Pogonophryne albipinna TaxID=1090488 RepID=A0AAD6AEC9_9TELE|nr:hypothetical protein JOQ06_015385 [Pogonophryne albipinna]